MNPFEELILHPATKTALTSYLKNPPHALLLTGPAGMGKGNLTRHYGAAVLHLTPEQFDQHAYVRIVTPENGRTIKIEAIREVQHFLSLRVPSAAGINRIVMLEDAHLMGDEAQNALLKTLEEPPQDTILLLTAASTQSLLPTIRSRVQTLSLVRPTAQMLKEYFMKQGITATRIAKAHMMSGGLSGLMHALLSDDTDHPLVKATDTARELLQKSTFDRLTMVDGLSKQKEECLQTLFILQQMADVSLQTSADKPDSLKRWKTVLEASYEAHEQLTSNGQPKLVLTNLMLNL